MKLRGNYRENGKIIKCSAQNIWEEIILKNGERSALKYDTKMEKLLIGLHVHFTPSPLLCFFFSGGFWIVQVCHNLCEFKCVYALCLKDTASFSYSLPVCLTIFPPFFQKKIPVHWQWFRAQYTTILCCLHIAFDSCWEGNCRYCFNALPPDMPHPRAGSNLKTNWTWWRKKKKYNLSLQGSLWLPESTEWQSMEGKKAVGFKANMSPVLF